MRLKMKNKFRIDELTLVFAVAIIAMISSVYKNGGMENVEAEKLTDMILDDHTVSFVNKGIVDRDRLMQIKSMDYQELKKSLKARNDFCIYIEEGNGNIIMAKGTDKLSRDGISCSE